MDYQYDYERPAPVKEDFTLYQRKVSWLADGSRVEYLEGQRYSGKDPVLVQDPPDHKQDWAWTHSKLGEPFVAMGRSDAIESNVGMLEAKKIRNKTEAV